MKILIIIFILAFFCTATKAQKHRSLIPTDIENEPDDAMSFVRFLTYANQKGIVASTSCWQSNKTAECRLHDITDAYTKVRDKLEMHKPGFPTETYIHSILKKGYPVFGKEGIGKGKDSEGRQWLYQVKFEKDNGTPTLSRYQRVIVTIIP